MHTPTCPTRPIHTGAEYIESLRGRKLRVFLMGEQIDEPVDHPVIRPSVNAVAATYDLAETHPELATVVSAQVLRIRQPVQELRPLGIVVRPELQGTSVVGRCGREGIQRERSIARDAHREPGSLRVDPRSACLRVVESSSEVVREHLGVILGASERLEPGGSREVLLRAASTRDLLVGDVPDERVPKEVLVLACDRAPAVSRSRLAPLFW